MATRKSMDISGTYVVHHKELFNDWGRRRYDDSVPGEVTKTPSSGDRTT